MFNRLLSPATEDEDTLVRAKALNLLALVMAVVIVLYWTVSAIATPGQITIGAAIALGAALALSLVCYWLGKSGRIQLAAYLLFVGLFVAISFYVTDPGNKITDLSLAPMLYLLVALPAGYILHPRASFIVTTLAVVYLFGFLLLTSPSAYVTFEDKPSFLSNVVLAFAISYILSAVTWVFSQGLNGMLMQTRAQNRKLEQIARELETQRYIQADTGAKILELAEQLTQYSTRQASGSNRQAAAVAQVSTSIGELELAAGEIAQSACLVDEAAQQTLQGAQQGQQVVWQNSEAMGLIQSNARQGAEEAADLSTHLRQVDRVATMMSNIASQIQLVAFNATLEAAEAGAAGQRFGVVAAEVKDLAADSLTQAKQVGQIVNQVQETGQDVVALSSEQVRVVEVGTDVMARTSAANQAIIDSAARLAELAGQIQEMTAQQQQASEQVAASVQEIKSVVDRWVVSSYQMDEMVASLQSLAEQLA